ncbi:MAG: hypothetical protein WC879_09385 [Melioribacteraceae bacterium]
MKKQKMKLKNKNSFITEEFINKLRNESGSEITTRFTKQGEVKMSEVLVEYGSPILQHATSDEEYRNAFSLVVFAWNLAHFPLQFRKKHIDEGRTIFNNFIDKAFFVEIVQTLVSRKLEYFMGIERLVANFEINGHGKDIHIQVASMSYNQENLNSINEF